MRYGAQTAVTRVFERISLVIASLPGRYFTHSDIQARLPDLTMSAIGRYTSQKCGQGRLERIDKGRYMRCGPIKTVLPQALVANHVWSVLPAHPDQAETSTALTILTEEGIGRKNLRLGKNVSTLLARWYAKGHVHRIGARASFRYYRAPGITERPVVQQ